MREQDMDRRGTDPGVEFVLGGLYRATKEASILRFPRAD
jgi:hypothetical protein